MTRCPGCGGEKQARRRFCRPVCEQRYLRRQRPLFVPEMTSFESELPSPGRSRQAQHSSEAAGPFDDLVLAVRAPAEGEMAPELRALIARDAVPALVEASVHGETSQERRVRLHLDAAIHSSGAR